MRGALSRDRPATRIAAAMDRVLAARAACQVGKRRLSRAKAASLLALLVFCARIVAISSSSGGNFSQGSTGPWAVLSRRQSCEMESRRRVVIGDSVQNAECRVQ